MKFETFRCTQEPYGGHISTIRSFFLNWKKNHFCNFFEAPQPFLVRIFLQSAQKLKYSAPKWIFQKNQSNKSKIRNQQVSRMALAHSELRALVRSMKIERQVRFWRCLIFAYFWSLRNACKAVSLKNVFLGWESRFSKIASNHFRMTRSNEKWSLRPPDAPKNLTVVIYRL